ncbi:MAG: bifunctional folylpolyglutamate synthase/dihydrofolate synthase [Lachnospiraceae bacterium]|nr:bifunctional folylpolyglutamate synthase/dihydrofolate synthase [Lachnospiraceae bacterium]
MDYTEARAYIDEIGKAGRVFGLETMTSLLELLGNPQDHLKLIHIAGTNGKGSVLAYLSAILKEAGYQVGRYVSPTLFSYRERIQVNEAYIGREDFARLMTRTAWAIEEMKRQGIRIPTAFEAETAVAFLYFCEQKCDVVVLETGLGGRTDATSVVKTTILSVLTHISMDHMGVLGSTLREIAWNKAGILRDGIPAVSAFQEEEAAEVLVREAGEHHCELRFVKPDQITGIEYGVERQKFSYRGYQDLVIPLAGRHQIGNAALALEAVDVLKSQGFPVKEEAVREGFAKTVWKGRFSVIAREPYIIIDGAHNPDAAQVLRSSVEEYFADRKKYFMFGVFSDKDYEQIIDLTADLAEHIVTVETPGEPRALPAEQLAEAVRRKNPSVEAADSIQEGARICRQLAGKDDVILVFGSLSFLAEAEQAFLDLQDA